MFRPRRFLQSQLRNFSQTYSRPNVQNSRRTISEAVGNLIRTPRRRRLFYTITFGGLGIAAARFIEKNYGNPPMPGTDEDSIRMKAIESLFNRWPDVRKLRENPDYVESPVYENYSEEERAHRLSSGPLHGSRGLALQVGLPIHP